MSEVNIGLIWKIFKVLVEGESLEDGYKRIENDIFEDEAAACGIDEWKK